MADEARLTRRGFLTRLAVLLAAAPCAVRCGGAAGPTVADVEAQAKSYDPNLACTDTKGLWPAELQTRIDNEYRDRSGTPGRYCFVCANFEKPKVSGRCGSCTTVKGPIQPLGWCKTWTERRG